MRDLCQQSEGATRELPFFIIALDESFSCSQHWSQMNSRRLTTIAPV